MVPGESRSVATGLFNLFMDGVVRKVLQRSWREGQAGDEVGLGRNPVVAC